MSLVDQKVNVNGSEGGPSSTSLRDLYSNASYIEYIILSLGIASASATGAAIPYMNIIFGEILDKLNEDSTDSDFQEGVNKVAILFGYTSAAVFCTGFLKVFCFSWVGERQAQKLREKYVWHLLRQDISFFDGGASDLSTKVADLCGKIQDGIGRKSGDIIQYSVQFIASFIAALYLSWKLTLVLLVSFPAIGLAGWFMITAVTEATTNALLQYAEAGGLATEALNAIRTVSALNLQPEVIRMYRRNVMSAMNIGIRKGFKIGVGNGLVFGVMFVCNGLGFWYGSVLVAEDVRDECDSNCFTAGQVMAVFFCIVMGSIALGQVSPPIAAMVSAITAASQIKQMCEMKPEIDAMSDEGLIPAEALSGSISFTAVSFSYPSRPDVKVYSDYCLDILPGEVVALCGASGCGKSTAANLLMRFYTANAGELNLDGRDIKEYNVKWLRSQIGYVAQEPFLFSGSIAQNIADGLVDGNSLLLDDQSTMEKVRAAARLANAHDFIMQLPENYNTKIGANGLGLSGGQKQRIAISRALIRRPSILVFDEATSALDATSEKLVQESIDALQRNRTQTTIIIAHRLSTIRRADKIALIENGKVSELGTHDELMALDGLYADLVRTQVDSSSSSQPQADPLSEEESAQEDKVDLCSEKLPNGETTHSEIACDKDEPERENAKEGRDHTALEIIHPVDPPKGLKRLWAIVVLHWGWLAVGILGASVYGAVFPIWGWVLAVAQDSLYDEDPESIERKGARVGVVFALLGIVCIVSCTCEYWGVAHVGERLSARIRSSLFESLMHRGVGFYDTEEHSSGTLSTQLADDSRLMHKATGEALAKQIQAVFSLVFAFIISFVASWKIALVTLGVFPLNVIGSTIQMEELSGQQYDTSHTGDSNHAAVLGSAFTQMRTVNALSLQKKVGDIYMEGSRKVAAMRAKKAVVSGIGFGFSNAIEMGTYGLLFWYGATLIVKDEISFLELFTSLICLMMGTFGLGVALQDIGDQKEGMKAAQRVFELIDQSAADPLDGLSTKGAAPTSAASGRIEFRNVSFSYPSRKNTKACSNYSVTIEAGESLALVGPSGGGKSTIMSLLLRFYDPDEGEILLDGVNIKDLNIRWLRDSIGYVGQEPVLFSGSVKENIAKGRVSSSDYSATEVLDLDHDPDLEKASYFGSPLESKDAVKSDVIPSLSYKPVSPEHRDIEMATTNPSVDEDILEACRLSNCHEFVSGFPQGYDTDVGEGSIMVSGGQKQRIAIARAIVKRPSILLLDEATSALDAASEKIVQESINSLQEKRSHTTIIIAHRLTTIKNADKIAVVDSGEIVELGTHDELLGKGGLYFQLWSKQQAREGKFAKLMDKTREESMKVLGR